MQDRPGMDGSDEDEDESSFSAAETNSSPSSLNRGAEDNLERNNHSDERSTRDVPMALPREHSYLEESHPLLPDADRYRRTESSYASCGNTTQHERPTNANANTHELAVLELHGVVLFPGCTIPVKLRNRSMIRYLGKQIQLCRTDPVAQPRVLLGILPYEARSPPSRPRPLWQTSVDFERPRQRRRHNDGRGGRGGGWMRQRFSFGNGEIAPTASSHRLRQALTRLRDEFQFLDSDDDENNESESGDDTELHHLDEHFDEEDYGGTSPSQHPLPKSSHPLVGRIGTIATVQHTHERSGGSSSSTTTSGVHSSPASSLWGSYEEDAELVFTAVGTSRFRILSCINDEKDIFEVEELAEANPLRPPFSTVQLPFRGRRATRPLVDDDENETSETKNQAASTITTVSTRLPTPSERSAWNLSQLTPLPYFLYRNRMPWSLVEKITTALKTNNGKGSLPSLGDDSMMTNRTKLERACYKLYRIVSNRIVSYCILHYRMREQTYPYLFAVGSSFEWSCVFCRFLWNAISCIPFLLWSGLIWIRYSVLVLVLFSLSLSTNFSHEILCRSCFFRQREFSPTGWPTTVPSRRTNGRNSSGWIRFWNASCTSGKPSRN